MSTPYTTTAALVAGSPIAQANQLSRALAVTNVVNEYLTDTTITAYTDWVFSMPTRRYGVAYNYASSASDKRVFTTGNNFFQSTNTTTSGLLVCVVEPSIGATALFDREETTPGATFDFVISPGTGTPALRLCGEVSVLGFNGSNVLGAALATQNIAVLTAMVGRGSPPRYRRCGSAYPGCCFRQGHWPCSCWQVHQLQHHQHAPFHPLIWVDCGAAVCSVKRGEIPAFFICSHSIFDIP